MAFNVFYRAWDTSANAGKTGDGANHTVSVEVNGSAVTGLTETEVANGLYRVELSDGQCPEGARFAAYGSSSTANVAIIGESGVRPQAMRGTDGAATAAALSAVDGKVDVVDGLIDAIKAVTDLLPNAGALSDLATLASRLSAARAGYLDKLNVTGVLAHSDAAATYKADVSGLATAAALATIAGYLDTEIAAILEDTGTTLPAAIAAIETGSGASVADILAGAVDGALTLADAIKQMRAVLAGKAAITGTDPKAIAYRNAADSATVLTHSVDAAGTARTVS